MPFPNFHAARIKSPGAFIQIVTLKTLPNGIQIIGGVLKSDSGGSSKPQSYRFPKDRFTAEQARKWLTDHDIKWMMFESAQDKKETTAFRIKLFSKEIKSFTQDEIIGLIPESILSKIKEKDEHPFFTVYSICHEGESSPVIIGEGARKISWPRKAIESIKNLITRGIKLFKGHNKDNTHKGRKVIGKVIHSFEQEIEGILHHLIIAYHKPGDVEEIKQYDVCSQEATWNFFEEAGKLIADTIEGLTGIALANSNEQMPAFAEAKRLGYIQAFEPSGDGGSNLKNGVNNMAKKTEQNQNVNSDPGVQVDDPNAQKQNQNLQTQQNQNVNQNQNFIPPTNMNRIPEKHLTFEEMKNEIKRMKVYPHQLFEMDDLKRDREFGAIFNEVVLLKEEKVKSDLTIKNLTRSAELSTAKGRIETLIKEKKTPQKISEFILEIFEDDKETVKDLTDKGLETFVETKTKLFQRTAKKIDPDFDIDQKSGDGKGGTVDDLTKADNNELLEEDYDE